MTQGPSPSISAADPSDASSGRLRISDRVLGLVGIFVSVLYTIGARTFDGTAFSSGPVGPKTLPTAIGILFGLLSFGIAIRPDTDPRWPTRQAGWQILLVVACSYVYGQIMEWAGFIVASAAMTIILGTLFKAPLKRLLPLAAAFPIVLAFIFNNWLELRLPSGWWGGF